MAEYPILLVEDDLNDIAITVRAFKQGKIKNKLYVVEGGEQALDFLEKKGYEDTPLPCLILLDLKMPKVNGFDVLKQIKQDEGLKSIPVIVLTSSESDRDIEKAYQLGCNNYIAKPVNLENFIKTVITIADYWLEVSRIPRRGK